MDLLSAEGAERRLGTMAVPAERWPETRRRQLKIGAADYTVMTAVLVVRSAVERAVEGAMCD